MQTQKVNLSHTSLKPFYQASGKLKLWLEMSNAEVYRRGDTGIFQIVMHYTLKGQDSK